MAYSAPQTIANPIKRVICIKKNNNTKSQMYSNCMLVCIENYVTLVTVAI